MQAKNLGKTQAGAADEHNGGACCQALAHALLDAFQAAVSGKNPRQLVVSGSSAVTDRVRVSLEALGFQPTPDGDSIVLTLQ